MQDFIIATDANISAPVNYQSEWKGLSIVADSVEEATAFIDGLNKLFKDDEAGLRRWLGEPDEARTQFLQQRLPPIIGTGAQVHAPIEVKQVGTRIEIHLIRNTYRVSEMKTLLQAYYKNQDASIQRVLTTLPRRLPIEKCFVNLSIIEKRSQTEQEKQALGNQGLENRDGIYSSYEAIFSDHAKASVKPNELFSRTNKHRLIVFGRVGIGKSTLTQYLSYQWATEQLWEDKFEFVFKIKLRNLTKKNYSNIKPFLPNIIAKECFANDKLSDEEINRIANTVGQLIQQGPPILIILDSLDEFDENTSPCNKAIVDLLNGTQTSPHVHLLVTSRPFTKTAYQYLSSEQVEQLECMGFLTDDIPKYIQLEEVKPNLEEQTDIIKFLENNSNIHALVHVPLLLDMLCAIWDKDLPKEKALMTMTEFYEKFMQKLWEQYNTRQKELYPKLKPKEMTERKNKAKQFLEILAFNAMQKNQVMISGELVCNAVKEMYQCDKEDIVNYIQEIFEPGLLCSPNFASDNYEHCDYYFPHLTFQEFFAAKLLCQNKEVLYKKFREFHMKPEYGVLWRFVAGINEEFLQNLKEVLSTTPIVNDYQLINKFEFVCTVLDEMPNLNVRIKEHAEIINWFKQYFIIVFQGKDLQKYADETENILQKIPSLVKSLNILTLIDELIIEDEVYKLTILFKIAAQHELFRDQLNGCVVNFIAKKEITTDIIWLLQMLNHFDEKILLKIKALLPMSLYTLPNGSVKLEAARFIIEKSYAFEKYMTREEFQRCAWFVANSNATTITIDVKRRHLAFPVEAGDPVFVLTDRPNFNGMSGQQRHAEIETQIKRLKSLLVPGFKFVNGNIEIFINYYKFIHDNFQQHDKLDRKAVINGLYLVYKKHEIDSLGTEEEIKNGITKCCDKFIKKIGNLHGLGLMACWLKYVERFPAPLVSEIISIIEYTDYFYLDDMYKLIRWHLTELIMAEGVNLAEHRFFNLNHHDISLEFTPLYALLKEYKADYENGKSCHEIMSMILQKIRYSPKQDERLEFVDNKIKIYISKALHKNLIYTIEFENTRPAIQLEQFLSQKEIEKDYFMLKMTSELKSILPRIFLPSYNYRFELQRLKPDFVLIRFISSQDKPLQENKQLKILKHELSQLLFTQCTQVAFQNSPGGKELIIIADKLIINLLVDLLLKQTPRAQPEIYKANRYATLFSRPVARRQEDVVITEAEEQVTGLICPVQ